MDFKENLGSETAGGLIVSHTETHFHQMSFTIHNSGGMFVFDEIFHGQ
jgi:hypothetical protein